MGRGEERAAVRVGKWRVGLVIGRRVRSVFEEGVGGVAATGAGLGVATFGVEVAVVGEIDGGEAFASFGEVLVEDTLSGEGALMPALVVEEEEEESSAVVTEEEPTSFGPGTSTLEFSTGVTEFEPVLVEDKLSGEGTFLPALVVEEEESSAMPTEEEPPSSKPSPSALESSACSSLDPIV